MKMNEASVKDVEKLESAPTELERWDKRHPPADILPATDSPSQVLANAIAQGAGKEALEMLERAFELDLKYKAQQAKEAFFSAMSDFHKMAPPVKKDKINTQFGTPYTSLENYLNTYRPVMASCGLSPSHQTLKQDENGLTVECRITHELGHSEAYPMTSPIIKGAVGKVSGQSSRNAMQDIKATFTYLRSATFEAAMGVAGTDATVDSDGNLSTNADEISDDQFATIQALMDETKTKEGFFCKSMKIESIDKMPVSKYESAVKILEARRK
jgi:hypothetical protein